MRVQPVGEREAEGTTLTCYRNLREAFSLPSIPLFFLYLGAFPEYLEYLTQQIVPLVYDDEFTYQCRETGNQTYGLLHKQFPPQDERADWLTRYRAHPGFYNFQQGLDHIYITNVKIAYLFIALREAVKGWAIAARKLPTETSFTTHPVEEGSFIYDTEDMAHIVSGTSDESSPKHSITVPASATEKRAIERDLLPEYLLLCRNEYASLLKTEAYLDIRLQVEKTILHNLPTLPHPIVSPINVVLTLTSPYPTFPDLLHLLSEHFPTYAAQRMLFSGFLLQK
jgi:hypothetical protein